MALYSRGRARQSLIDTAAFRAVSQLATIAGYIVLVRGMTEEDFGILSLLYAIIPVVSTVASLGLEQVLRRYQPEYLSAGNRAGAAWLVRFVASARFGTNVIVIALILLTWNHIAPVFKLAAYRAEFLVFALLIVLHFQARVLELTLASHMLHRYSVGSTTALAIAKLIGYGVLASQDALTLERAIFTDIAAYAIAYGLMSFAHRRYCSPAAAERTFQPDSTERKRLLRYGVMNNFNDAGSLVLSTNLDSFFIAAFIDPISVGVYAFYNRLNAMLHNIQPVRLFENVVRPLFFGIRKTDADAMMPRYFSLLLNLNLVPQWTILAFVIGYHAEIVTVVFGGKFLDHSWMLPLIIGFATFNTVAVPATLVAQYEEKAGIILLSKVFAIYNVVALLLLVPKAGIYGAAIASGSSSVLKNAFIWWHVRRRAVWTNALPALTTALALWGGVVALCWLIRTMTDMPDLLQLLVGALVCGLAAVMHMRSPAISRADRATLSGVFGGREARLLRIVGLLPAVNAVGQRP